MLSAAAACLHRLADAKLTKSPGTIQSVGRLCKIRKQIVPGRMSNGRREYVVLTRRQSCLPLLEILVLTRTGY